MSGIFFLAVLSEKNIMFEASYSEARSLILRRIVSLRLNLGKLINVMFFFVVWDVLFFLNASLTLSFKAIDVWFLHFDMEW